jgi:hypothetical protein
MVKRGEGGLIRVGLDGEEGVLRIDLGRGSGVRGAAFPPGDIVLIELAEGFEISGDRAASWDDFVGFVLEGEVTFLFSSGSESVGANEAFWVDPPDGVSSGGGAKIVGTRAKTPGG